MPFAISISIRVDHSWIDCILSLVAVLLTLALLLYSETRWL